MTDELVREKIEEGLEQIRPNIQMDGGDIEFVKFEDGVLYIKFLGACVGCPASIITLKMAIEETLRSYVPGLREVVALEDEN